jgi:nicotinamidase-related amidase
MAIWDDVITERDKLVYKAAGHGAERVGFGQKPVLVVIDVTYEFTGDKPEPILESIKRFPKSSGEESWRAIYQIASLLPVAREKHVPIVYTAMDKGLTPEGWLRTKSARGPAYNSAKNYEIVREIAPTEKDIVIRKSRASIFFGTPLLSILNSLKADTLLICGGITSGCVRASVTDAFAYNYRVIVIEEATFDWGQMSHRINLFDMNTKYADVLSVTEVMDYLREL